MGQYTPRHHRPDEGRLYPLEEEGTYGKVPKKVHAAKWAEPGPYVKRERKTKMYASYAISDKCELHALVLDKYDRRAKQRSQTSPAPSARSSRAASAPPEYLKAEEEKEYLSERGQSLPPRLVNDVTEDLNMLSKLQLAKEVEEDTAGSLRSVLGEEELTQNNQ
jgi:hypothetical protein